MIPSNITKEHVLQAIEDIDSNGLRYQLGKSSVYDLIYNGKAYPPKHTLIIANEFANGELLNYRKLNTTSAQSYITNLSEDFIIKARENNPLPKLIEKYKLYLEETQLKEELYKWELLGQYKGKPDVDAMDFGREVREIDYRNLIFHNGIAVRNHICKEKPEEYRSAFKMLFNEELDINSRVSLFENAVGKIYRSMGQSLHHHHDERTIATLLAFHNPDKYPLFKDSFYSKYCQLQGLKPKGKGEKYGHYAELLQDFIEEYVVPDNELLANVSRLIPDNVYQDQNHLLLAQDILYQTLDKQYGVGRRYWRVGTKEGELSYWDYLYSNKKIAIGWSDIGDLNALNVRNKMDIKNVLNKLNYYNKDGKVQSRKAGEIFNFFDGIKPGDIILAQDGYHILGIGVIKDEYIFNPEHAFSHQKDIEWITDKIEFKNSQGNQTTVYRLTDPGLINKVDQLLNDSLSSQPEVPNLMSNHPLNQILFGPPGTGKTYNTINKALKIINEEAERQLDWNNRKAVKAQFHKRIDEGRIVFSTFHQNMAYEDFIEGIKPGLEDDENEKVSYSIVDGVLKSLSKKALSEYYKILEGTEENREVNRIQLFDEAWNNLAESIQFKLDNQENLELNSKNNKPMRVLKITQQGNFILQPKVASLEEYTVSYKRTQKLFEAFPNLDAVKNIDKEFRQVIGGANSTAYWCVLSYLNSWIESNSASTLAVELKPINESLISFDNHIVKADKQVARYVLIIDEINRGNVSQIFGELITLIEEDKRLGKDEALLATLPYSKKKFGVPPNLYLIGTMNTADRSVEALDTALRRRFHFQEMPPVAALISSHGKLKESLGIMNSGLHLGILLKTINARIEKLLDKDHLIGHSFFMQVDTLDKLKEAFQNKIIPLLQEYFYGDFGKIELVLGSGFVREKNTEVKGLFAKSKYDTSGLEDKPVYELMDYTKEVDYTLEINKIPTKVDFNKAIELLLNVEPA